MKTEYRIRAKEIYYITRFHDDGEGVCDSRSLGEHTSAETAYQVAYALAKAEHERLGYAISDERIVYPERPDEINAQPAS